MENKIETLEEIAITQFGMPSEIHYGFGKEYLKSWSIKEALREIYQNFLDFGDYHENSFEHDEHSFVSLSNEWKPESLDFLRIGNSMKNNVNAIGKHGEGVKMAFLILHRMGYESKIITPKFIVYPEFYTDKEIGECFALVYREHNIPEQAFTVEFQCLTSEYKSFKDNLILKSDVIFTDNNYGEIVSKPQGNIYSGGLFVCHHENISRSYNISPAHLPLDRDRQVPQSFDVSWATSKINDKYGKWTTKDLSFSDTAYLTKVPDDIKKEFKPKMVGNDIQFIVKVDGKDKVIHNNNLKEALKADSFFAAIIKKFKMFIAKQLGLYDLLVEFKSKHVHNADAIADFEVILERVKK